MSVSRARQNSWKGMPHTLNQVKQLTFSWRTLICKGNTVLYRFTLNFRLTIQRKQKDKSGVPGRVTPCVWNVMPGKNKFIESQNKRTVNTCEKGIYTQAHLITLFLLKPLITSKVWNPTNSPQERKETLHPKWAPQTQCHKYLNMQFVKQEVKNIQN